LPTKRTERRLAAILAADVAGYSRLMGVDEEGTLARLKEHRREVIDPKLAEHKGRVVKTTGDGMLVEFASVVDALRCAAETQTAMADRNAGIPPADRIEFRVGIHQGDIIVEGDDIFGDGVNVAARLEPLAEPGGICVSSRVQEDAAGRLDLDFDDLGEQILKNIARPVRVYRVRPSSPLPGPPPPAGEGSALARVGAAEPLPLPDKPSIAVLPFQNMSGDPEQEFFADGMVEDITTALSKLRWFFVIARNSSFAYKGRAVDVKQVGRELGVRYVLEGNVRRGGNRLRITAQLVEAATGNHVWAERYDREISDLFAVQDEITERVVAAIEPELYAAENIRSQRKPPENLDAWECVIRALNDIGQGTREANEEAEALCRRAIEIFPGYGQAHSLLAWALLRRTIWAGDFQAVVPEATAEARIALDLDDRDPWAYLSQGMLFQRLRRLDDSERTWGRALELNPNFALAYAIRAMPMALRGAYAEAIDSAEHALRLSPSDRLVGIYAAFALTLTHFAAGRYSEAAASARKLIERAGGVRGLLFLAASLAHCEDSDGATDAVAALLRLQPGFSIAWMTENLPLVGDAGNRVREGLLKAGVPER
jgi:adenylate cyclase